MVRDEADIVQSVLENLFAQGVDLVIATDNGSIDGTTEILESFGNRIDLRHDPVHKKQQYSTVSQMAHDAYTLHGADWVINIDADEFWLPAAPETTLHEVFSHIPKTLGCFDVPVFDMTGQPAKKGTGLNRLIYRDLRPLERMNEIGLHDHATKNCAHIGQADVNISQGNHFVSIEQQGSLPKGLEVEVLHFPWRSWQQFSRKVLQSGNAYEANPKLAPSPNHHGMREYARHKAGTLQAFYIGRHPNAFEQNQCVLKGHLVEDRRISDTFGAGAIEDTPFSGDILSAFYPLAQALATLELETRKLNEERIPALTEELHNAHAEHLKTQELLVNAEERITVLRNHETSLINMLHMLRNRKVVRYSDAIVRGLRRGK